MVESEFNNKKNLRINKLKLDLSILTRQVFVNSQWENGPRSL